MKNKRFASARFLVFFFCLFIMAGVVPLYSKDFTQTLNWSADPNVLEYKIEIRDSTGKTVKTLTTENNSISLSLGEGSYKYRITAYDFLGRESVSTEWISFDVLVAKQPEIKHEKNLEALAEDGKSLELDLNVADVTSDTVAELVNVETGEKISGSLVLSSASSAAAGTGLSASETHLATKAQFAEVPEGNWKLVVTNPSGLSSESEKFEVRDVIKEQKIAAQKAEEERLAREEAERKERERLEAERLAREEAERKEQERLEAERLAREEAERLERERLEAEERARLEAEQLAREQAEREEAERLAREQEERERLEREEAERLAKEEAAAAKKAAREERKKKPALGIEFKVGSALVMNYFENDFYGFNNTNITFIDSMMGQKDEKGGSFPEELQLAPYVALSYVPDWGLPVNPGLEIRYHTFRLKHVEDDFKMISTDEFEYTQQVNFNSIQANAIGQVKLIPQKILFNAKLGGGIMIVNAYTLYMRSRRNTSHYYIYPILGTGLSFEFIPFKHFVFEIGADYDIILSDKVNYSYPMPYLNMGVRF